MSEPIEFFLTGPTWVRPDVREAMTQDLIGHRSPDFKELHGRVAPGLQEVFRTSADVPLITGSGSLVWDIVLVSAVSRDVLCLTNGAFSERFLAVARAWGKSADEVAVPWGRPLDPDVVRQALRRRSYEAVTLAHNETSTGVLNPLAEIAEVVREESDALILVDAVSSLAGTEVETDTWGLDLVFASAQKALALPPGLALAAFSERAQERAERIPHRGYYTDLTRYVAKHRAAGTVTTPALPQIWALERQLEVILEEGLDARFDRHRALRRRTEEWAAERGFEYASSADGASPTVSCLRPPAGIDPPALVARLKARGITVGSGYGPWKPETFRIGHMGEVRLADLERLLAAIDEETDALRAK